MIFPTWADDTGLPDHVRAQKRLRFICLTLAAHASESGTAGELHARCGLDTTTFWRAIRNGRFAPSSAATIEKTFGRELVTHEMLTDPLSIGG